MTRRWWKAALAAAVLLPLALDVRLAHASGRRHEGAPNTVTSLSVVPGAGAANVVISIAGGVDVSDFTLENPRRIVIDLRGATLGMPAKLYDKVARGGITDIRYAMFKSDVVRIVLVLDGSRDYTLVRGEKDVTVAVTGPDAFTMWHVGAKIPAPGVMANAAGAPGAAVTSAPARSTTFASAVPTVSQPFATAPADQAPADAAPRNILSKSSVKPSARPEAPSEEPHITVSYQETNIRDVITAFAKFSNRTIIIGKAVEGIFTGDIIDKPWDVALRQILQSQGLAALEDSSNGIITVDSYTNLADREKVEPLMTKVIQVNYAKADAMANTVKSLLTAGCGGGSGGAAQQMQQQQQQAPAGGAPANVSGGGAAACSTRGAVVSEEKTNTIIVTETAQRLADIESYVHDLDVRTPQVSIKAKIISVDRTGTEQLGLSYDLGSASGFSNSLVQRFQADGQTPIPGDYRVNLGGDAFAAVANASRPYKTTASTSLIYNMVLGGFNLTSFVDALASEQLSDVQAEPSTTTVDNKEARLFAGSTISYLLTPPVPAGQITSVAPQIQTRQIGIELRVTPHVTANRQVLLDVYANHEVISSISAAGPTTSKRESTNQVLVGDGETAVIGGLTQSQVSKNRIGIPILMNLPGIGRFFSSVDTIERKQDLLILITPHIVDDGEVARPGSQKP